MNVKVPGNKFRQNTHYSAKKDSTELCEYCQNTGHPKDKCFFLHGYPEWHRLYGKPKPKLKQFGATNVKKDANVTTKPHGDPQGKHTNEHNSKDVFTEAQCEQIVNLIQQTMKNISTWNSPVSGSHLSGPFPEDNGRDW